MRKKYSGHNKKYPTDKFPFNYHFSINYQRNMSNLRRPVRKKSDKTPHPATKKSRPPSGPMPGSGRRPLKQLPRSGRLSGDKARFSAHPAKNVGTIILKW
jgi:hypothetical protein